MYTSNLPVYRRCHPKKQRYSLGGLFAAVFLVLRSDCPSFLPLLFKIGFEGAQFAHRYQEWPGIEEMREKTTKHFTPGFATGIILEKDLGSVSLRFDYTFVKHKSVKDSYTSLWYDDTGDEQTIHQEAKSPAMHAVTLGVAVYF